jgi:hypothetical protein
MESLKIQSYKLIKKNIYTIFLILIGIFFLQPLLNNSFYLSHDGQAHVARFAAYYKSFLDGQFIPRWAADLNANYGSPLFIFFYPLPGYIASFIHFLGLSFEAVFKVLIFSSFLLSPVFLFTWLRTKGKPLYAFLTSVVYLALPYRFLDTFVRGDVAELLSFVFIPLIFLYIDRVLKKQSACDVIWGSFFYALFVLSHNGVAVIFTPVFLIYSIIEARKTKNYFHVGLIFLFGLGLSAFFWLPSVLEGKYTMAGTALRNLYKSNFISINNLFYSPWGFGPDTNIKGGLSAQIGVLNGIIPFLILPFINKFKEKKMVVFWVVIFIAAFFMETKYSVILWDRLPVLYLLGFPWRITILSGFASTVLFFYLFNKIDRKALSIVIIIMVLLSSIPLMKFDKLISRKDDNFYLNYIGTTDYSLRTNTIWTAGEFYKVPLAQIEIANGQAMVNDFKKRSISHSFKLNAKTDVLVVDNTVYFPGWKVLVDNRKVPIEFQDINHRGLITFSVKKGMHDVKIFLSETPIRLFSDIISALSLIGIIFFVVKKKNKK